MVLSRLLQFILVAFIPSAERSLDGKAAWCDEKRTWDLGSNKLGKVSTHHELGPCLGYSLLSLFLHLQRREDNNLLPNSFTRMWRKSSDNIL